MMVGLLQRLIGRRWAAISRWGQIQCSQKAPVGRFSFVSTLARGSGFQSCHYRLILSLFVTVLPRGMLASVLRRRPRPEPSAASMLDLVS